ncbi:MAG TPA: tetratricopeptide repeat protein [Candidatus Aquilonibacter sp.]|nr:tetratricopeptide repeat protein [Candidatus Aquilonibacter sp.]
MRWSVVFLFSLGVSVAAQQQALPGSQQAAPPQRQALPAPQHQANFEAERRQADELFVSGKHQEALPLYEDLCKQDQTIPVFAERHGLLLLEKAETTEDIKQKTELGSAGLAELQRAQRLGDNSPLLVQTLYNASKTPLGAVIGAPYGMLPLTVGYTHVASARAQALYDQGEQEFGQQNFAQAAKLYIKASEADPQFYLAALNAGDSYFREKDWKQAGIWFQKAVAIDPDRETAYRYWGDALWAAGDKMGAKAKFIDAIIAEPFVGSTWSKLQQWAGATHTPFIIVRVHRPEFTTPNGQLKVDPALEKETGDGHASWLVYEQVRVAHGARTPGQLMMAGATMKDGQFTPSGYVHTLDEELAALNAMLDDVQRKVAAGTVTDANMEPGIRAMLELRKQGFLGPFEMLNFHDAGLRHEYPAYRAGHRELLVSYMNTVVAPGVVQ